MILEKGLGQLDKAENFRVEARGLIIQPETGKASARVMLGSGARVEVAALTGSFRVYNHERAGGEPGVRQGPGIRAAAVESPSKLTGCLAIRGTHYLLTDETTNVIVELNGPGLDREKGNRVEVTGGMDPAATPVSDASQFIRVTGVKRLSKGCPTTSGTAAAAGSGGPTGKNPSSHGGLSTTTVVAVIGGIAAAVLVGGLAATGKLTGNATSNTISQ